MVSFHVTKHIFKLFKNGLKNHEYRNYNRYWKVRLMHLRLPTSAQIVEGYTNNTIEIIIDSFNIISRDDIPTDYKKFITTLYCFDIIIKKV